MFGGLQMTEAQNLDRFAEAYGMTSTACTEVPESLSLPVRSRSGNDVRGGVLIRRARRRW
jgi:hypothetical protein